ncbi:MAG: hypothetical protein JW731_12450 [Bacteroidales bacterium]|nr:hypothetical protein [Bacteroidales bacterium]
MIFRVINIITLFFLFPGFLSAQIRSVEKNTIPDYLGVGLDLGFTSFYGDIDDGPVDGNWLNNIATKIHVTRTFGPVFSMEGNISVGKISAEKRKGITFYNYFKARFIEYTFSAGINLMPVIYPKINEKLNIIPFIGIGLIDFKTQRYDGIADTLIKSYGYDGQKSTTEMVVPFGIKGLYHISNRSAVSLQALISRVNTDKMDGLEGNSNTDYFNFVSFGYVYKFYPGSKLGNVSKSSFKNKKRTKQKSGKKSKVKKE